MQGSKQENRHPEARTHPTAESLRPSPPPVPKPPDTLPPAVTPHTRQTCPAPGAWLPATSTGRRTPGTGRASERHASPSERQPTGTQVRARTRRPDRAEPPASENRRFEREHPAKTAPEARHGPKTIRTASEKAHRSSYHANRCRAGGKNAPTKCPGAENTDFKNPHNTLIIKHLKIAWGGKKKVKTSRILQTKCINFCTLKTAGFLLRTPHPATEVNHVVQHISQ